MGPNGSGKSTLANVIAGNEDYKVQSGEVVIVGRSVGKRDDLLKMKPDMRAKAGIFLSFQNPPVISGVEVGNFLRQVYLGARENPPTSQLRRAKREKALSLGDFRIWVLDLMRRLSLKPEIFSANLNETMSGGEKKKLEILQMILLKPKLIILDEIDSGLDVDALKTICREINLYKKENPDSSFLIVSHYNRIFQYIKPDRVHIMKGGRIVKDGDGRLVEEIEKTGYGKY